MPATPKEHGAAPREDAGLRLRLEVYGALAEKKGANTVTAQAALHGISRYHMHRLLRGEQIPSLPLAMRMAADFGTTVEALFERRQRQNEVA